MKMQAIILVGGLGTRLRKVIKNIPKPLADINGKPFIEIVLDKLIDCGFTSVVFAAGYLGDCFLNKYKTGYKNLSIKTIVENEPLLTGGAVKSALKCISNDEPIFILNGDTFVDIDYQLMYKEFIARNSRLMMVVGFVNDIARYGSVELSNNYKITNFKEKTTEQKEGFINQGVLLVRKEIFENINKTKFSLEEDFLKKCKSEFGLEIDCFINRKLFIDIGVPEDYIKALGIFK